MTSRTPTSSKNHTTAMLLTAAFALFASPLHASEQPFGPAEPEPQQQPTSTNPATSPREQPTNAGLTRLLDEIQSNQPATAEADNPPADPPAVLDNAPYTQPTQLPESSPGTESTPQRQPIDFLAEPGADLDQSPATSQTDDWLTNLRAQYQDSTLPGMLLAVGVLIVMFIMMRRLARRGTTSRQHEDPRDRIESINERALSSIPPLERSVANAEATARQLAAMLDNKADRIDLLIREADAKLNELNTALARVSRETPVPRRETSQHPASSEAARPAPRTIDPALLDRARIEQDIAERTPDPRQSDVRQPEPRQPDPYAAEPYQTASFQTEPRAMQDTDTGDRLDAPQNPSHRRIWELADDGLRPFEIARTLNQPIGQVELILNLRKSG